PKAVLATPDHISIATLLASLLARTRTNIVVRVANTVSVSLMNSGKVQARLIPLLMRWLYGRAHAVVAVSNGVAEDLVKTTGLPRELVQTIYNPVVTSDLAQKAAEQPLPHPWFESGAPPVILGVGRLVPQKDF